MAVDINKELNFIRQIPVVGNYLGDALQRITKGVNLTGSMWAWILQACFRHRIRSSNST